MSDLLRKIDATLRAGLELTPCACGCGKHISSRSQSPWFAEEDCQKRFTARANRTRIFAPAVPSEPLDMPASLPPSPDDGVWRWENGRLDGQPVARWDHEDPVRELWRAPGTDGIAGHYLTYRCVKKGCTEPSAGTTDFCTRHTPFLVKAWRWLRDSVSDYFYNVGLTLSDIRSWVVILGGGAVAGLLVSVFSKLGWFQ